MNLLIALAIGILSGAHCSTWGMYKDSIHEGFTWPKYFRSMLIAGFWALLLESLLKFDLSQPGQMVVFFGLVYVCERLTLEFWKGFVREEDQSKYFIPMRFGVLGKPVMDNRIRYAVFAGVLIVIALAILGVTKLQQTHPEIPTWLILVTFGCLAGWLSAFGGAWKDAPVEGFETFKFFRSPAVSLFWATLLAFFTRNWVLISLSAAGYGAASIETYKTFFFPNKPRGKFAGKPILYPEMVKRRYYFAPVFVVVWVVVLAAWAVALSGPHTGLI